jgi:hypothetical protein
MDKRKRAARTTIADVCWGNAGSSTSLHSPSGDRIGQTSGCDGGILSHAARAECRSLHCARPGQTAIPCALDQLTSIVTGPGRHVRVKNKVKMRPVWAQEAIYEGGFTSAQSGGIFPTERSSRDSPTASIAPRPRLLGGCLGENLSPPVSRH